MRRLHRLNPAMLILLITVLLSGVAILIASSVTSSLQVSDFGTAALAAAAMSVVGWVLSMPLMMAEHALMGWLSGSAEPPNPVTGWWLYAYHVRIALIFIENFVLFVIVGLVMSGITIRGFLGPFLAVVLMTLIDVFLPDAIGRAGLAF